MTDDNSTTSDGGENLVDMDNLDNFSNTFFGQDKTPDPEPEAPEKPENEEDPENEDDALATEKTDDEADDEDLEENPDGDETEEDAKPKPKKKTFQDRIDELTAKARNEERLRIDLERRLAEIEARKPEDAKSPEPKKQVEASAEAPTPADLDEDGEPKYRLGEFDPLFIRDLTKFTINEERARAKAEDAEAEQKRLVEAAQEELKGSWLSKVEDAEKELPDLRENLGKVGEAFAGIDPNYGEFLAATIMTCDFGPQIMYYLSQNIGEAQKIVASGPAAATLAIGRLDARFSKPVKEDKRNTNKVSNAPNPPENRNRGSGVKGSVAADTTDLGAFEKEFFKKA